MSLAHVHDDDVCYCGSIKMSKIRASKPYRPFFSSGPCVKYPSFDVSNYDVSLLGRSHRSADILAYIHKLLYLIRSQLEIPNDYSIAITPGSATGAMEMALWSFLGSRPVTVFAWEKFGLLWLEDIVNNLELKGVSTFSEDYGLLPDLFHDGSHDIIFPYNGTSSGVCVPDLDWISNDRKGLIICDATSAVVAYDIDWSKLDVTTFSFQKCIGGEGQHGVIVLSRRAVERLEFYQPRWPIPNIFNLKDGRGKFNQELFLGKTLNTPSLLCLQDAFLGFSWMQSEGGLSAMIRRVNGNYAVLESWVKKTSWIDFLVKEPRIRSKTSVTLEFMEGRLANIKDQRENLLKYLKFLEKEAIALDIKNYVTAPIGLRIWCGATVNQEDLERLCVCLDESYEKFNNDDFFHSL